MAGRSVFCLLRRTRKVCNDFPTLLEIDAVRYWRGRRLDEGEQLRCRRGLDRMRRVEMVTVRSPG